MSSSLEHALAKARSILDERTIPSQEEIESLREAANWGRWGLSDEVGAVNLIGREKRLHALSLVDSGQCISLSRPVPTDDSGADRPVAKREIIRREAEGPHGSLHEEHLIRFHGTSTTHIDALSHVWESGRFWNGKAATPDATPNGVSWGAITNWADGIVTRALLFDVPAHRGAAYVEPERPVHGWELEDIASASGFAVEPGDALIVYSGREVWEREHGPYRAPLPSAQLSSATPALPRPGLHPSCLAFIRLVDAGVLVWDMMDTRPSGYRSTLTVHCAIPWYGVVLVDNAALDRLVEESRRSQRREFALILAPLRTPGGTGSAINPIVLF